MATFPTPKVIPLFTTDCKGDPIFEDSYLRARRWWPPHYCSSPCYLWRIERGKTGKLMLVAQGDKRRVPLTKGRGLELEVYQPSRCAQLADHPEVWAWWRASGWGLSLSAYAYPANRANNTPASSGTYFEAVRRNSHFGLIFRDSEPEAHQLTDPAFVRRALLTMLYYCLHPRKAATLPENGWLEGEAAAAFEKEQRRKMKKLGIS